MRASLDGLTWAITTDPGRAPLAASDLCDDIEIGGSATGTYALIAAGFFLTFLSSCLAFGWWDVAGYVDNAAGYVGILVFGIATCRLILMLPAERGPIVILNRYGIRDLRVANEFLLWDAITEILADERRGRKVIVLKLTSALQRQRCCIKSGQDERPGNRAAGADHIVVNPVGLSISFDALLQACQSFHAANEQRAALQHNNR